ncbi:MAG: glycosyltransferase [Candidatus Coatesbacteria bacterium]|nr:glycosyltransferase [Candidatus Coatesbacteria bacterium]
MNILLWAVFWVSTVIILFVLVGYSTITKILARRRGPLESIEPDEWPTVAILIPVFNEEKFIRQKLENILKADYPEDKIAFFVIDNDSTDRSAEIIQEFPVIMLQCERGKNKAINAGLAATDAEIVIVTDVDTTVGPSAVKEAVGLIRDDIGAVSGLVTLRDENIPYMKSKLRFHVSDWEMRYTEGLVDSACSLDGRFLAFRHDLVERLPEKAIIDDLEITFIVRKQGFRCVVSKNTPVLEACPETVWAEMVQIRRRVSTTLVTMGHYWTMIGNPRFGFFGAVTQPWRRAFALILPAFMLYNLVFLTVKLGLWVLWVSLAGMVALIAMREVFPLLQFAGIILGWFHILLGQVKPGGLWQRIERKD